MVDQLVMLLSTDWFVPYWSLVGLEVDSRRAATFQLGCRDIVKDLVSGAREYWHVSFSNERLRKTKAAFLALAERSQLENTAIDNAQLLDDEAPRGRSTKQNSGRVYFALTQRLLTSDSAMGGSYLDPSTRDVVRATLAKYDVDNIGFAEVCLASKSQWDCYVRELTPTQPTYLADYLVGEVLAVKAFDLFWLNVKKQLRPEQLDNLIKRYGATAKTIMGQDIDLPAPS